MLNIKKSRYLLDKDHKNTIVIVKTYRDKIMVLKLIWNEILKIISTYAPTPQVGLDVVRGERLGRV